MVLMVCTRSFPYYFTTCLYVVAMPIGQWSDLAPRAIEVLSQVNLILAEDTRVSGQILKSVGVLTRMVSFNSHSEVGKAGKVIEALELGNSLRAYFRRWNASNQ